MKIKRSVQEWSIDDLIQAQTRISFPDFQRERKLWSIRQKALLIDSILKDFDIPKLYFNQPDKKKNDFEVIDGQQRLWAIWDFFGDEYSVKSNGDELKFSELADPQHKTIKNTIEKYKLQITVFEEADRDYLSELFVRLQWGLLLVTGEKLHAASGEMKRFVFDQLAKRNFIQALGLPETRTRTPEKLFALRYASILFPGPNLAVLLPELAMRICLIFLRLMHILRVKIEVFSNSKPRE